MPLGRSFAYASIAMSTALKIDEAIEPMENFDDDFDDEFASSEYSGTRVSVFSSVTSSVNAHCFERGRLVNLISSQLP